MKANPKGRVDVLAMALAERLTHAKVDPHYGVDFAGRVVWPALKPIAQEGIKAAMKALGVPRKNLLDTPLGKAAVAAFDRTRVSGGCA